MNRYYINRYASRFEVVDTQSRKRPTSFPRNRKIAVLEFDSLKEMRALERHLNEKQGR